MPTQTRLTISLCFHEWINWINKLTLDCNTVSHCFTLITWGRPCHLSSFKLCSGDLISLWEQLVNQLGKRSVFLSLYYCIINTVNTKKIWVCISSPKRSFLKSQSDIFFSVCWVTAASHGRFQFIDRVSVAIRESFIATTKYHRGPSHSSPQRSCTAQSSSRPL